MKRSARAHGAYRERAAWRGNAVKFMAIGRRGGIRRASRRGNGKWRRQTSAAAGGMWQWQQAKSGGISGNQAGGIEIRNNGGIGVMPSYHHIKRH